MRTFAQAQGEAQAPATASSQAHAEEGMVLAGADRMEVHGAGMERWSSAHQLGGWLVELSNAPPTDIACARLEHAAAAQEPSASLNLELCGACC